MPQIHLLDRKLVIPENSPDTLPRKRMLELLTMEEPTRLIVVQAPAGYGKTTVLSQWALKSTDEIAWITLDYVDNDPIRFWQHISKAVGTAMRTDLYERLLPLFNSQPGLPIEWFVDLISNEIKATANHLTLMIDNYETINHSAIHRSIARFVDNMPKNCHVVISTERGLPLPTLRWKKCFVMKEISLDDIQFTDEEIVLYLKERNLSVDDLHKVQEFLEIPKGWPAGFTLAINMIENRSQISFSKNRPPHNHPDIFTRLFDSLLTTLPVETATFLLQTSVLNHLEPALCNQLTNRKDSAHLLSQLESKGLFINKLDGTDHIFHYDYQFCNLLRKESRSRMLSAELKSLHTTAAQYLYDQNDFMNAIEVALRGELYSTATMWIDKHMIEVFKMGQTETFLRWVDVLVRKEVEISISMSTVHAYALALLRNYEDALQVLEQLEAENAMIQWMTNKKYEAEIADYLGIKAYVLLFSRYDIDSSIKLLFKRLKLKITDSKLNVIAIQYNVISPQILRTDLGMKGKLWSEEVMQESFKIYKNPEYKKINIAGYSYALRAETLFERNRIGEAIPAIEEALQLGFYFQDLGLVVPMYLLKCKLEMIGNKFSEAFTLLKTLETYVIELQELHWLDLVYTMRSEIFLAKNDYTKAENELFKVDHSDQYIGGAENEFWWFVQVRLLISKQEYEHALQIVSRMKKVAIEEEQVSTIIEAGVLQAQIHTLIDNNRLAFDALHEAFELGYQYEYLRIFLGNAEIYLLIQTYIKLREKNRIITWDNVPLTYVEEIYKVFKQEQSDNESSADKENLLNALTPRELEVLELLKTGLSNREIAKKLYLTSGTVRIYLSNIYSKLNVTSRTQAIIIAKDN